MNGVVLVTGGGRGIGAACCRLAAKRGLGVAINYAHNRAAADALVAEIEAGGGEAVAIAGDVAVERDVCAMFDAAQRRGTLVGLINSAGIVAEAQRVEDMSLARLERMFAVNITGAFLCAREAVRRMSTRLGGKGGGIVNLSSAAARLSSPNQYVDYAASKAAIDVLTLGLSKEVAAEGIRVNAVRPGLIITDIHASGGQPNRVEELKHQVPMQRGGTAEEVANAILWLLSDEASYVTGALLDVGGGR